MDLSRFVALGIFLSYFGIICALFVLIFLSPRGAFRDGFGAPVARVFLLGALWSLFSTWYCRSLAYYCSVATHASSA